MTSVPTYETIIYHVLQSCLLAVLALAGVEDWSRDQSLATLLGLAIVLGPYLQYRGKVPDLAARMVNILMLQVIPSTDYL